MDSAEEAHDYDAMDHSQVNRVFVDDFRALYAGHGPVLDVGTGTAQIPIELAKRDPRITVVGVDLAKHMLAVARRNIDRAGLASQVRMEQIDAKGLPFGDASFVAVMSNSIVHHIPEPLGVLSEIARVVGKQGVIFVRDLLRPANDAEVRHLVVTYAADANAHQRAMFDASLRAALTLDEIRDMVASLGFPRETVQQTSDRHWTWSQVE
ncbi:MAG: class I SAM-dependent methyltransferase [Gemmataceae bacterium]|nr:class I SAM-dependent methyltransferase [Gemmataceae bacterium]